MSPATYYSNSCFPAFDKSAPYDATCDGKSCAEKIERMDEARFFRVAEARGWTFSRNGSKAWCPKHKRSSAPEAGVNK